MLTGLRAEVLRRIVGQRLGSVVECQDHRSQPGLGEGLLAADGAGERCAALGAAAVGHQGGGFGEGLPGGVAAAWPVGVGQPAVRLTGGATTPRAVRVTGIGFVPAGPHNGYADGAWLTPAGYDRIFAGGHYSFKFHAAAVALRPGANVQAVARRLNAAAAAIKGGRAFTFTPPSPLPDVQVIKDLELLPLALSAFLALLAVGAVGTP